MRARMINTFGYGGKLDAFVAHLQQESIPAAEEQPGYHGMLVLGDRTTEHVIVVTFWHRESQEHASAHSAYFERQLRANMPYLGMRLTHETFDVLLAAWPADRAPDGPPFDDAGAHAPADGN